VKILLLSDVECKALWDYYRPERIAGVDLIISCGDLKREYLEFLVTLSNKPLLYVPGNHDTGYVKNPPEGCEDIDGRIFNWRGVRILGLGGCKYYNNPIYQYTEKEMAKRIRKLRHTIKKAGGVDIVVTHAAPVGLGDRQDIAHQGFQCFVDMIDRWQPKYFVHGHVHMNYDSDLPRRMTYGSTEVINAYERYMIEV